MDVIELRGIRAFGKHGASEAERSQEQPLDIDMRVEMDLSVAASSDRLESTLDYAKLCERIIARVRQRSYRLLERLAAELLDVAFADVRVAAAEVAIAKPNILGGATPQIRIRKANPRYLAP
ncbi:MAG: dihydroneopterin aldolase [Candidatus Eremiobacteraeota bacterium]|nr:dihydroneopterin aldolase [Candidatus Eremiobacteraeota bacterium]